MKKLLIAAVLVMALAFTASAQAPVKPFNIYIGGGATLPQSPDYFKDNYKSMGFHGLLAVGINLPAVQGLAVLGKVQYHMVSSDWPAGTELVPGDTITGGGDTRILMFGVDGQYRFGTPGGPASPYAGFGVGFASSSASDFETTGGNYSFDGSTDFYWNIVAGVDLSLGPTLKLFGNVAYTSIATEGDATAMVPITVGLKF